MRVVRSCLAGASIFLGAICLPLLAGEAACRLAGYRGLERYRPDSTLGWVPAAGQATVTRVGSFPVRIDDDGFRGDPIASPKRAGTIRLFALGASTTFGWGVRQEDTYESILERMLNDTARAAGAAQRYEVVNGGVIGFNLRQDYRYMRRIVERWQPDGFIVAYTFNDAWNRFGSAGAPSLGRVLLGVRTKNVLRRSALYNWLVDLLARRRYAAAAARGPGAPALMQTADGPASPADLADFRATLDSMLALQRTRHLSLAFVVQAARDQGAAWPRQLDLERFAGTARLPVLDLFPAFEAAGRDSLYLAGDAVHPSARGHALIARLLYTALCRAAASAGPGASEAIYRSGCGRGGEVHGPQKLRARPHSGDAPG